MWFNTVMIILPIENPSAFATARPGLAEALAAIEKLSPYTPDGRTDLADGAYLIVSRYATAPAEDKPYEAHRKYIDVQVLLAGEEFIGLAETAELAEQTPYDPQADVALYHAPAREHQLVLQPDWAVVLDPADAHRPGCCLDQPADVCKVVAKLPVAE